MPFTILSSDSDMEEKETERNTDGRLGTRKGNLLFIIHVMFILLIFSFFVSNLVFRKAITKSPDQTFGHNDGEDKENVPGRYSTSALTFGGDAAPPGHFQWSTKSRKIGY